MNSLEMHELSTTQLTVLVAAVGAAAFALGLLHTRHVSKIVVGEFINGLKACGVTREQIHAAAKSMRKRL
jgi:hypothetical protein